MSSSVIDENDKKEMKGILAVAVEVIESSVASPSASKPCTSLQKAVKKKKP
jgi:hypothetical protein